jgi:hypothetical protein
MSLRSGLFWIVSVLACGQLHAADEFISLPSGLTQTLTLQTDNSYSVRIGISLAEGVNFEDLHLRLFEVQFKDRRSEDLITQFQAALVAGTETLGPALTVQVPADATRILPGNYSLTLHMTSTKAPPAAKKEEATKAKSAVKMQSLVLALTKPAPSLSVGPAVYIERTAWFPSEHIAGFDIPTEIIQGTLRLTEESNVARLSNVTLTVDKDQKQAARLVDGRITLPADPPSLSAGETHEYPVSVDGDFPPGTYTGKINIRSPDLASATSVNYEVRSRRSAGWLIVLAIVGAGLGFLVRVYLKGKRDRNDAKIGASNAIGRLAQAFDRIEEPDARTAINGARDRLNAVIASGKSADIVTETAAALSALQKTEADFNKSLEVFQPKLGQLTTFLDKGWDLPPAVRADFDLVCAKRALIAAALARYNVTEADKQLSDTLRGPLLDAVKASIKWRTGLAGYVASLDARPPALSDDNLQTLRVLAEGIRARLAVDPYPVQTDVANAESHLTQTYGSYQSIKEVVAGLPAASAAFLSQARESFKRAGPAQNEWDAVAESTKALMANVTAEPGNFTTRTPELVQLLSAQRGAWRTLLGQLVMPGKMSEIDPLLEERSWKVVIDKAASHGVLVTQTQLDGVPQQPTMTPDAKLPSADLGQFPGTGAVEPKDRRPPIALTGDEHERIALRSSSNWAEAFQTVVVASLFVAGVYALNQDTWVGTWKEMLTIFLLAFGVDLTADGVVNTLKR